MSTETQPEPEGRWRALSLIAAGELLAMSLWFSASAVVPDLRAEWSLSDGQTSWLSLAVQLGFVAGTLLSAILNLPDLLNVRRLIVGAAILGAASNLAFSLLAQGFGAAVALRFVTGMALAAVYPPGMKLMATWFRRGRGLALGVLIGALTVGKAFPYLVNALGIEAWRWRMAGISALPLLGALLIGALVQDGPYSMPAAPFDFRQVGRVFANRGVRLANFGYFGHMWELYAMWTWAPVMIRLSLAEAGSDPGLAELVSFLVIGAGGAGCVLAGLLADRVGRTLVTSWAMVLSGACCIGVGFLMELHPVWLILVGTLWGATVVADSAQFSTCVTELGDARYMGTALTIQTCIGFLITLASMALIPELAIRVGWRYAFMVLALGPIFGVASMLRLRSLPEAAQIAGGRR